MLRSFAWQGPERRLDFRLEKSENIPCNSPTLTEFLAC
jgi:hypothetical protein